MVFKVELEDHMNLQMRQVDHLVPFDHLFLLLDSCYVMLVHCHGLEMWQHSSAYQLTRKEAHYMVMLVGIEASALKCMGQIVVLPSLA